MNTRVDTLGYYVFKYSDDHGKSWSEKRYPIDVREFQCDHDNIYGGKVRFFWNVGRPFTDNGTLYASLHKVHNFGPGHMVGSEGCLIASNNIMTESDPEKIAWITLPDGDVGLKTPPGGGAIAEEQCHVVLSDGTFYVSYRSSDGYPVEAYSRDKGRTWNTPKYMKYANGKVIKHPRAAAFTWKCENGKYLFWCHNHGGHFIAELDHNLAAANGLSRDYRCSAFDNRNPVWICGGMEVDKPQGREIRWSQPEILFYDDDPFIRMSYPDLVEDKGKYYITETQKKIARVHEIDATFLEKIWSGLEVELTRSSQDSLVETDCKREEQIIDPVIIKPFYMRNTREFDFSGIHSTGGFSLEFLAFIPDVDNDSYLLDARRREDRRGMALKLCPGGRLEFFVKDIYLEHTFRSEYCLNLNAVNYIVVNMDGGPKILNYLVNGAFCDGTEESQVGWFRFSPFLSHLNWAEKWTLGKQVADFKVNDRVLMSADAVINYNAYTGNNE